MKIITDHSVYVQRKDIAFLTQCDIAIPTSIFKKMFQKDVNIIDENNIFEFIEFDKPDEIKFFDGLHYIVDYNQIKDLSDKEIMDFIKCIEQDKNDIIRQYSAMTFEQQRSHKRMISQCEMLEFKIYTLKDFLEFKHGSIKLNLPEGVEYPTNISKVKTLLKNFINKFNK